jgi:hypothetical protein
LALVFIFLANNPSFYLGCLLYGNKKIKKPLKFPNNLSQTLFNLFTDKLTKKGMIGKNKHKLPQIEIFSNITKDVLMKLSDLSTPITYNI